MADGTVEGMPPPPRRFGEPRRLPALSVVVIAGADIAALQRCLVALLAQDFVGAQFEIVVVDPDDRATLRQQVALRARQAGGAPAVQYLVVSRADGLAAARNRGWMYSRGAVIAFIDPDGVPARDWLQRGMAALVPGVVAVHGCVRMALSDLPDDHERENAELAQRGLLGCNCFVSRIGLVAVGGFDERFSEDWRCDTDLHFTLIEHFRDGQRVRPAPLAHVLLGPRPEPWHAGLRQQQRLQFEVLLMRKHPRLYRERAGCVFSHLQLGVQFAASLLLLVTAGALLVASTAVAGAAVLLWLPLIAIGYLQHRAAAGRVGGKRWQEWGAVVLTLVAIPPLALFWRSVGALRFRVRRPQRLS